MTMEELLSLPPAVSVATAARALSIGADKAYELIKDGEFPARTIGANSEGGDGLTVGGIGGAPVR